MDAASIDRHLGHLACDSLPGQEGARPPALWQAEAVGRPLKLMPQDFQKAQKSLGLSNCCPNSCLKAQK